jgi:NAD-dependent SIR2 family protein deacetylase
MQKRLVYAVTVTILDRQYSKRKQTLYIYGTSGKTHPVASTAVMQM